MKPQLDQTVASNRRQMPGRQARPSPRRLVDAGPGCIWQETFRRRGPGATDSEPEGTTSTLHHNAFFGTELCGPDIRTVYLLTVFGQAGRFRGIVDGTTTAKRADPEKRGKEVFPNNSTSEALPNEKIS